MKPAWPVHAPAARRRDAPSLLPSADDRAVRKTCADEAPARGAVAHRPNSDRHLVAGGERRRPPALTSQRIGPARLDAPFDLLAAVVLDEELYPRMRVRPLKLLDDSGQLDHALAVERSGGVMRVRQDRNEGESRGRQPRADAFESMLEEHR